MSSYVALYNDKGEFLIAKKAVLNSYWDGKDCGRPTVVNQAGQYSLIGGNSPKATSPREEAIDEFEEETGERFPTPHTWKCYNIDHIDSTDYWLVTFKVVIDIFKLRDTINNNLAQVTFKQGRMNAIGPKSTKIKDWELDQVLVVPQDKLDAYLGVKVDVPDKHKDIVSKRPPWSQAIDWYAEMAGILKGIDCKA